MEERKEESPKRYIESLGFLSSTSVIQSIGCQKNPDVICRNLNHRIKGKHIFPIKIWTCDPQKAVTNIVFQTMNEVTPEGFKRLPVNLSQNTYAKNKQQYLCIRQGGQGKKLLDVNFYIFDQKFPFTKIDDWHVFQQFLYRKDSNDSQSYLYILYKIQV